MSVLSRLSIITLPALAAALLMTFVHYRSAYDRLEEACSAVEKLYRLVESNEDMKVDAGEVLCARDETGRVLLSRQ